MSVHLLDSHHCTRADLVEAHKNPVPEKKRVMCHDRFVIS